MKSIRLLLPVLCCVILLSNCSSPTGEKEPSNTPDSAFDKLSDEYLAGYFAWLPQLGTYLGLHQYDGKLKDYSKSSIETELTRLKEYESKLVSFPKDSLSARIYYDYRILLSALRQEIFSIEDLSIYTK